MCLFAGTLPATRLAVAGIDPVLLTFARATMSGAAGLLVLIGTGRRLPPSSLWLEIFAGAFCTVLCFPLLAALAMTTLPASHGAIVLGILPLATAAAASLFAHERPSLGFWLASTAGSVIVLTFIYRQSGGRGFSSGDLLLLGTVAAGAVGYTLSGRLAARMPGWEVISWQVVIFLPVAAMVTWLLWPSDVAPVPVSAWAGLGYVGLVSQYLAFFVFNAAMALSGIARIGQIMLLQPFVIVALAYPVNRESISIETVIFAAAVVLVVLIGQRMQVRRF